MQIEPKLVRADSWEFPNTQLLKTTSNAQDCCFIGNNSASGPQTVQEERSVKIPPNSFQNAVKPPLAPEQPSFNSTDSSVTGVKSDEALAPNQLLQPMRHISLEEMTTTEFCKQETLPDRTSIFNDVMEQLTAKEESLPVQAGLYTLPSIQFLESLLDDLDSKTASNGNQPADPPFYLPLDAFDLPFEDNKPERMFAPSPFDMPRQLSRPQPQPPMHHTSSASALHHTHSAPHGFIPNSNSMPILPQGHPAYQGSSQIPHSRSAGPSPTKPPRRPTSVYLDAEYEDDPFLHTTKAGRMRKAASFAGAKRKVSGEFCASRPSLEMHSSLHHPTCINDTISGSDTGATTLEDETDDEVSKGSKAGRKLGTGMKRAASARPASTAAATRHPSGGAGPWARARCAMRAVCGTRRGCPSTAGPSGRAWCCHQVLCSHLGCTFLGSSFSLQRTSEAPGSALVAK